MITGIANRIQASSNASDIVIIEGDVTEVQNKIDNSYALDLQEAYGYVKDIIPFEQSEDTGVTLTGGAYGTTGLKVGSDSYGADNVGANKVFTASFTAKDLTKLNNGITSTADDYITLPVTVTGTLPTAIRMELSSNVGAIDVNDFNQDLTPSLNFQVLKFKKSLFTQTGSPNWNNIGYVKITAIGGDATTDIWMDKTQLVAKDAVGDYPNPLSSQGWTINGGEWFVGEEFGEIVLADLASTSATNKLTSDKLFSEFNATCTFTVVQNVTGNGCIWRIDNTNYISAFLTTTELRFRKSDGGVLTTEAETISISEGDKFTFNIVKTASKAILYAYKNGAYLTTSSLDVYFTDVGSFSPYSAGIGLNQRFSNISITNIAHAHHADIAEVARGLTEQARARVYNTSDIALPTGVSTQITFDTISFDNRSHFDAVNDRLYVRETGLYLIYGHVQFNANSTGRRIVNININGSVKADVAHPNNGANALSLEINAILELSVDDYVTLVAFQDSGVSINAEANLDRGLVLTIAKIG